MYAKDQNGFTIVEILLVVLVLAFVGIGAYFVYSRQNDKSDSASQDSSQSQQEDTQRDASITGELGVDFVPPAGWQTVTNNGITVSYPNGWDGKVRVIGKVTEPYIASGFGNPAGWRHISGSMWEEVSIIDSSIQSTQPTLAPVNVTGADSTIMINGGDGGCSGSQIGFAAKGQLYAVALPADCADAAAGTDGLDSGVPAASVKQQLDTIIKSIKLQ